MVPFNPQNSIGGERRGISQISRESPIPFEHNDRHVPMNLVIGNQISKDSRRQSDNGQMITYGTGNTNLSLSMKHPKSHQDYLWGADLL